MCCTERESADSGKNGKVEDEKDRILHPVGVLSAFCIYCDHKTNHGRAKLQPGFLLLHTTP
jgi:hypothetical protein